MADLIRTASNNIAYGGTNVQEGFTHDDLDIKNLYSIATKQRGFFYGSSPPQQPNEGDKWHDSANGVKWWNGSGWVDLISTDADTVKGYEPGVGANDLLILDGNGKVPKANLPFNVPIGGTILWKFGLDATNNYPVKDGITYTDWKVDTDFSGVFPLGVSASHAINTTGGEETHTLTVEEIPAHDHVIKQMVIGGGGGSAFVNYNNNTVTQNTELTGGGLEHNNMPPYRSVYFITRIA